MGERIILCKVLLEVTWGKGATWKTQS